MRVIDPKTMGTGTLLRDAQESIARLDEVNRLTIELAEAKDEIARLNGSLFVLKEHVRDLSADLDSAVQECNNDHGEGLL